MFYANFTVRKVVDHLVQAIRKNKNIHDILKDGHAFGVTQNQNEDATNFSKRRGIALKPYFDGYYHQEESGDEEIFLAKDINSTGVIYLLLSYDILKDNTSSIMTSNGISDITTLHTVLPEYDVTYNMVLQVKNLNVQYNIFSKQLETAATNQGSTSRVATVSSSTDDSSSNETVAKSSSVTEHPQNEDIPKATKKPSAKVSESEETSTNETESEETSLID